MSETYAQLNQDRDIIQVFRQKGLYFIDIGANDGITLSNTYLLEKKYNWIGICSEPGNDYNKLKQVRNVICDNDAVYSQSNLYLDFTNSGLFSGITEHISHNITNNNIKKIKTITLQDLLDKYNAPKIIHYMSLDTEGTELEILKSVNLDEYKFLYINVEHNWEEPKRSNIRKLLLDNGYIFRYENKWDEDYFHNSIITGTYYYKNDYSKPIIITLGEKDEKYNKYTIKVSSEYWEDDIGIFNPPQLEITWNKLGRGRVHYNYIIFKNHIWHRHIESQEHLDNMVDS